MTPAESQSSEELPKSEENQTAAPASSSSNSVPIRVKNVSEINCNEAEANPSPPTKRKLPSWMLPSSMQVDSPKNKKGRTSFNSQCAPTSSVSNDEDECGVAPSTSGIVLQEAAEERRQSLLEEGEQITEGQNNNDEARPNNEAVVENEAEDLSAAAPVIASTSSGTHSTTETKVKAEKDNDGEEVTVGQITPTSPRDIKPAVKVEKEEATSSTARVSCRFGIRCYRQNPLHRIEEAHPGDKDYRRPDFPAPPDGTPSCPFADLCYRRNPSHFQQFSHPPSTDFERNWKNYKSRLRTRQPQGNVTNSSHSNDEYDDETDDDYDLLDAFIDDNSEDEFIPTEDGDDEEDDDDFL